MTLLVGIYGASGCGRGIMPLARDQFRDTGAELVFVDDGLADTEVNGHPVLTYADFLGRPASRRGVAIAIANGAVRARLDARCAADGIDPIAITARDHVRMDMVDVGPGAILSPHVTFTSNIRIGRCFHANLYSYVEHDCVIGDYVTFAPRVMCNGNVHIGDGAYIGTGAILRQGTPDKPLRIGAGATVGMGAVVTKDVPDGAVVVGNPARPLIKD